jgi:hypothetical protein
MKLIENYTPEELAARHIKVYKGGHHGDTSSTLSDRIDALEDRNLPAITPEDIKVIDYLPIMNSASYPQLVDRINKLTAEVRFLEKKLNENYKPTDIELKTSGRL